MSSLGSSFAVLGFEASLKSLDNTWSKPITVEIKVSVSTTDLNWGGCYGRKRLKRKLGQPEIETSGLETDLQEQPGFILEALKKRESHSDFQHIKESLLVGFGLIKSWMNGTWSADVALHFVQSRYPLGMVEESTAIRACLLKTRHSVQCIYLSSNESCFRSWMFLVRDSTS